MKRKIKYIAGIIVCLVVVLFGGNEIIKNNEDKDILIVTHGMCVRYLIGYFKNEFEESKIIDYPIFHQASYNEVEWNGENFEVITLNNIDHYEYDK